MNSNKQKGVAQLAVVAVMAFLVLGLPLATNLVQQNQENRISAYYQLGQPCRLTSSCQPPLICSNNVCKKGVERTGNQGLNQSCNKESDCLSPYVCYPFNVPGVCKVRSGGECTSSTDCYANHYCSRKNNHCKDKNEYNLPDYSVEGLSLESILRGPTPTKITTKKPTATPIRKPTITPTRRPTSTPTKRPTATPTKRPTITPTRRPTSTPTNRPTATPTKVQIANGVCGTSHNKTTSTKPATGLCSTNYGGSVVAGSVSDKSKSYVWSCWGKNGGTAVSCWTFAPIVPTSRPTATPTRRPTATPTRRPTATPTPKPIAVYGKCGYSRNTCSSGSFVDSTDTSTLYVWRCLGKNGGTSVSCSSRKSGSINTIN